MCMSRYLLDCVLPSPWISLTPARLGAHKNSFSARELVQGSEVHTWHIQGPKSNPQHTMPPLKQHQCISDVP